MESTTKMNEFQKLRLRDTATLSKPFLRLIRGGAPFSKIQVRLSL